MVKSPPMPLLRFKPVYQLSTSSWSLTRRSLSSMSIFASSCLAPMTRCVASVSFSSTVRGSVVSGAIAHAQFARDRREGFPDRLIDCVPQRASLIRIVHNKAGPIVTATQYRPCIAHTIAPHAVPALSTGGHDLHTEPAVVLRRRTIDTQADHTAETCAVEVAIELRGYIALHL